MKNVRTAVVLLSLLIAAFLLLVSRCFYLQYLKGRHYYSVSIEQQKGRIIERPQRGSIIDCRGRLLAVSKKYQNIFAEPRKIEDAKSTAVKLAPIVNMESRDIHTIILQSENPGYAKIKTDANEIQCKMAMEITGIGVESAWQRNYPMEQLASNPVGFTSMDNHGLDGIELQYDSVLTGIAGKNTFAADVFRRPIQPITQDVIAVDGKTIVLTIDATIQQYAREELLKKYKEYQAESAVAIVAQAKTGAILAMVSLPDFNPNDIGSADPNHFRNRAITDQFEPGSMLKPVVVAIALDSGVVNKTETIYCENGHYHGKGFGQIGEYENHRFGDLTLREVLVKSSNIGMAKIGQRFDRSKLHKALELFGFGRQTGIELSGEAEGLLWPTSKWTGYSVTRIPYGQEISVTAMQMVKAFCILANGGHVVQPHLVTAVIDKNGEIKRTMQPPPVGYIIKPETAEWIVRNALVGVVNEKQNGGTGWRAKLEKWQVFGKTGTANIAKSDEKGYSETEYTASFIGGAPAENPRIIVLVSIRKPNKKLGKGYTGGAVASPVVGKIIEKTLTYLEKVEAGC